MVREEKRKEADGKTGSEVTKMPGKENVSRREGVSAADSEEAKDYMEYLMS